MGEKSNMQSKSARSAHRELPDQIMNRDNSEHLTIPILELDLFSLGGLLLTGQVQMKQSMGHLREDVSMEHEYVFKQEICSHDRKNL